MAKKKKGVNEVSIVESQGHKIEFKVEGTKLPEEWVKKNETSEKTEKSGKKNQEANKGDLKKITIYIGVVLIIIVVLYVAFYVL